MKRFFILLALLLAITGTATAVTLERDANGASEDGYRLFWRLQSAGYNNNKPLATLAGTRFVDETTAVCETYCYVVRTFEDEDESGDSNEVTYSTFAGQPLGGLAGFTLGENDKHMFFDL